MKREIRIYGDDVLRKKSKLVERVDETIRTLVDDLLETMRASNGLGLAAEQIGRTECICVIDIPPGAEREDAMALNAKVPMPLILINPHITEMTGEQTGQEGCLSFPEVYVNIKRADRVRVSYLTLDNTTASVDAGGLLARAIQHEVDHLNGILLVDRMSPVKRVSLSGKLKRLRKRVAEPQPA